MIRIGKRNNFHKEEWRQLKEIKYNGVSTRIVDVIYVSNFGRVKKEKNGILRLAVINEHDKYCTISLNLIGKRTKVFIHRLVATAFCMNPNPAKYDVVDHIDGKKHHNMAWNLEWCDIKENTNRAIDKNLWNPVGSNNAFVKLDETTVIEIAKMIENGMKRKEITSIVNSWGYNVSRTTIHDIHKRSTWSHTTKDYNFPEVTKCKKYDDELLHSICKLIVKDHTDGDISTILDLETIMKGDRDNKRLASRCREYVHTIRTGQYRRDISQQYFPIT